MATIASVHLDLLVSESFLEVILSELKWHFIHRSNFCYFHTFLGNNCEIEVNECLSQPCRNGGSCVDELNSFSCQCPLGLTGILYVFTRLLKPLCVE